MNTDNVKSQMRKGILEYCTLLILQKRRAYVSDIIQSLKEAKLIVWRERYTRFSPALKTPDYLLTFGKNPRKVPRGSIMNLLPKELFF